MAQHVLDPDQVSTLMVKRQLEYLEIQSNVANPTYQVDINTGIVGSDDGTVVMEVGSPITVDITNTGVANGLDTGSEASSTWYYLYLIYNPSSDVVAGLFSISASSPTMPSGYTKKRLVGAVRNDGSSNFAKFFQRGNVVYYAAYSLVLTAGTSLAYTPLNLSSYAPPNISKEALLTLDADYQTVGAGGRPSYLSWDGTNDLWYCYAYYSAGTANRQRTQSCDPVPLYDTTPNVWYKVFTNGSANLFLHGFSLKL